MCGIGGCQGDQSGDWERRKRQAGNGEGEEVVRKRSKVSGPPGAGPAGGSFKPFDYESTQFTNFTKGTVTWQCSVS